MTRDLVSIIIVNWNGLSHLKKCLPSLYKQKYKKIEIILVDNASSDDSVKWVRKYNPGVKIIVNNQNLGFSEANNIGFNIAKGEFVLFLNNDTLVTNNFLTELLKVLKSDQKIGGAQSKIFFMDSPKQLDSVGAFLTNTGFLFHYGVYEHDSPKFSKVIDLYTLKGAAMIFKKTVLERILINGELFDPKFFAYFEETDLCHRVWLAGFRVVFAPKSVIYHKFGATSSRLKKSFIEFNSYKNRINSYLKNLGFFELIKILSVHIAICELLSLLFIFKGRLGISIAIQKAIFWNFLNINATLIKRSIIQNNIRKINDREILQKIKKDPGLGYYISLLKGWNITQINVNKKN